MPHAPSHWHVSVWSKPTSVVEAGALIHQARAPYALAHAAPRGNLGAAFEDAAVFDALFAACPAAQHCAAAQAAQSLHRNSWRG